MKLVKQNRTTLVNFQLPSYLRGLSKQEVITVIYSIQSTIATYGVRVGPNVINMMSPRNHTESQINQLQLTEVQLCLDRTTSLRWKVLHTVSEKQRTRISLCSFSTMTDPDIKEPEIFCVQGEHVHSL